MFRQDVRNRKQANIQIENKCFQRDSKEQPSAPQAGVLLLLPQWQCISSFVFTFLSHLFSLPCGAGSTVPREVLDPSVIMPFPGVL